MYCIFGEHLQTHCNPTRLTLQRLWSSASVAALPFIQSIRTRRPALSGSPWIHRGTLLHPPHLSLHFEMSGKASCLKNYQDSCPKSGQIASIWPIGCPSFPHLPQGLLEKGLFSGHSVSLRLDFNGFWTNFFTLPSYELTRLDRLHLSSLAIGPQW